MIKFDPKMVNFYNVIEQLQWLLNFTIVAN